MIDIRSNGQRAAARNMDAFPARYARSYVDRLFEERDMMRLYQVVGVLRREHEVPEEFWLFSRLLEWIASTRSGVWQYYETLAGEKARRIYIGLEQYGLHQIAELHQSGVDQWEDDARMADLDNRIDVSASEIEAAAFGMILERREALYP